MSRAVIIKSIVAVIGCFVIIFGSTWLWHYKTNFPVPDHRTAQDFMAPLLAQEPQLFTTKNTPVFTITNIDHPQKNWYILTIKAKNDDSGIESKLVMNDPYFSTEYITVVAGPETVFLKSELNQDGVPDQVIQEATR